MDTKVIPEGAWMEYSGKPDRRSVLIAYLDMKVDEQDWHGVADAAMDLRELDAEARGVALGKQDRS